MSGNTTIEWSDKSWNPLRGCSVYTKECINCYAMRTAHRYAGPGGPFEGLTQTVKGKPVWTGNIRLVPEDLEKPLTWEKPALVFVNSMSDLFHEDVPEDYIREVFEVMRRAEHHTFQVLTKRAERVLELSDRLPWGRNVWMGVSIGCQENAYKADLLARTGAAVKWVSAEPLIGPVNLQLAGIAWVVIGGESGPGSRPLEPQWIRDLIGQCHAVGASPFVKQMGSEWSKARYGKQWMREDYKGKKIETWDVDLRVREYPKQ